MSPSNLRDRPLNDWYVQLNRLYLDRNFYRDEFSILAHLVEVMGGLSLLASEKLTASGTDSTGKVRVATYIPKALAWWMALCGRLGVRSVEQMLWWKFPLVCPYCQQAPCPGAKCAREKRVRREEGTSVPDWEALERAGRTAEERAHDAEQHGEPIARAEVRPRSLVEWQQMFDRIYPVGHAGFDRIFARFTEELGELAESVRVFPIAPTYFLSEAADVFAWIVHLHNSVCAARDLPPESWGLTLANEFADAYPDRCKDCGGTVCLCPPILPTTFGRIAHEVPRHRLHPSGSVIVPLEQAMELFSGARAIEVAGSKIEVDTDLIQQLHSGVRQLLNFALTDREAEGFRTVQVVDALSQLSDLTRGLRLNQESIDALVAAVRAAAAGETGATPPLWYARAREVLLGLNVNVGAAVLMSAFDGAMHVH